MVDRRLKLRHLQCFLEVARRRSFKEAADRLALTQPAISKTVKELEAILGARLLDRSRAGVALTAQGAAFARHAQAGLAALDAGFAQVTQAQGARATVSLGALPSVSTRLLPEVARRFAARAPAARLVIRDGQHGALTELLKAGALDLVLGRPGAPEAMQGLSFTQLYQEQAVFAVRPGHPLLDGPLDLAAAMTAFPVIYPPEGAAIRPLVDRFMIAAGIAEPPRAVETVSGAFGRVSVRGSDAIWVISAGVVAADVAEGRLALLPVDAALTAGPVGLMTRAGHEPAPAERLFREVVDEAVAALAIA